MADPIQEQRLAEILAQAKRSRSGDLGIALIEGLPPLARIAFTVRIARRVQRFFPFRVQPARLLIERAIAAAEKAASGDSLSEEEDRAACDDAVLHAGELERREGDEAAATAGMAARLTARCVYGPEIAYGENAFMADFRLQSTIRHYAQVAGDAVNENERIAQELRALEKDLNTLLLIAEESREGWIDPAGGTHPGKQRNDRGWARMLKEAGVPCGGAGTNRERWERIHKAVRRAGGRFYSQDLFAPI